MVDQSLKTAIYSSIYSRVYSDTTGSFMTEQNSPTLTPQAQRLLDILRAAGRWVNRTELAKLAGKSALNKWDIVLLTKLVGAALIESRQISHHGPIGYEWQYRAVNLETPEREA
jgi:hypothetical protein